MEDRVIRISLAKAKEWYYSNNSALKELALQVFTEKELKVPTYEEIEQFIPSVSFRKETDVLLRLSMYYRKPEDTGIFLTTSTKYFIGQTGYKEYQIMKHETVQYPGIPYFKRLEDVREAAKIFEKCFKVTVKSM